MMKLSKRKAKRIRPKAIKEDIVEETIATRGEELMLSKFVEVIVKIIKREVDS